MYAYIFPARESVGKITRANRAPCPPPPYSLAQTSLWAHGSGTKCVVFQLWLMHFVLCDWKCLIACQGWLRVVECGVFSLFLWFPGGGGEHIEKPEDAGETLVCYGIWLPLGDSRHTGSERIKSSRMDRGKKVGAGYEKRERKKEGGGNRGAHFPFFLKQWQLVLSLLTWQNAGVFKLKTAWKDGQLILPPQTSVRWSADIIRHMENTSDFR